MEESHYFFKNIGLESYMGHEKTFCDPLPRVDLDNLEYPSLEYSKAKTDETDVDKKEEPAGKEPLNVKEDINDDFNEVASSSIQAYDFFSSLELQSSSKTTSANVISLSFNNKLSGGIVTRSRSFSSSAHDSTRTSDKMEIKSRGTKRKITRDTSQKGKQNQKKGRKGYKTKARRRKRKCQVDKKPLTEERDRVAEVTEGKKICSVKAMDENSLEKSLGLQKSKDDDDWIFFRSLKSKKETESKPFESKQSLGSDARTPARRSTPELFSMSPILMSDAVSEERDDVDNLLEVEDFDDDDDNFLDEFNAPPRSHTGGKWKPGSLTIRTSPTLWQSQNWESFLDDRSGRSDSTAESPTENKTGGKWKCYAPPASHTGGKWKPITPPATHTSGKWKPQMPSSAYAGDKWKSSEGLHRTNKLEEALSPDDSNSNWKCDSQSDSHPSICHTGGKWKPSSFFNQSSEPSSPLKVKDKVPPPTHTRGKWVSEEGKALLKRSNLDVLANCQSSLGKCLKTAGGMIQYYCSPCNRRLSSKKMYKKHVQSELHFKRVLQENELEFDSRSLKMFRGLMTQTTQREGELGKRIIKKPQLYSGEDFVKEKKSLPAVKVKGKRVSKREIIRCEVCRIKIPSYQLGKHLVSYYHSRRIKLNDPEQRKLILNNIHAIVKQAPYQCDLCKFYCNTHILFKKHWALDIHKEVKDTGNRRFWCSFCSFECETSTLMELHLDSNSHREVILAVNKSIPIIIRHKVIIRCDICFKEFRYNRQLLHHKQHFHGLEESVSSVKFACSYCQQNCKSMKSLQRHILNTHKGSVKVPYFCSVCNVFFTMAADAKNHRNSQEHKYKKSLSEEGNSCKKTLSRICSFCNVTLENIDSLKRHLFDKHPTFLPKCIKCGMIFALSQEVSKHVRNNECDFSGKTSRPPSTGQIFECETCSFTTNSKSELLLHGTIHQKTDGLDKKIPCPLCGARFTQSALSIHLKTHLKELTYQCSLCSKAFVRKDRFLSHMKTKHFVKKVTVDGNDAESGESNIRLNQEVDKLKKERKKEIQSNRVANEKTSAETRETCREIKSKFSGKDEKDSDKQNFSPIGPKVFQCPDCSYCAKTNTVLKRHYLIHLDERSFPCPHCTFKARLKAHLKRHMRLHTGAKPYKCPHCPYACNILENLRKHVLNTKIHPGKKLYECKLCSFDTNVSKTFKAHLTTNHKDFYRPSEANAAAGIYNKDKDLINTDNPILKKAKAPTSTPNQVFTSRLSGSELKEKVDSICKTFRPIAAKSQAAAEKKVSPAPLKSTGSTVEDKRKVLEMELEKIRKQIKPDSKRIQKSYPSPVEKDLKAKMMGEAGDGLAEDAAKGLPKMKKTTSEIETIAGGENEVLFISEALPEETFAKDISSTSKSNPMVQQLSPSYILYDDAFPPDEIKLYLLEDYEV